MTPSAILIIMTSAAAVFMAIPVLRAYDRKRAATATSEIEACRDQLGHVEKEAAAGLIDSDQAETARVAITRRLLAAVRAFVPPRAGIPIRERNFSAPPLPR